MNTLLTASPCEQGYKGFQGVYLVRGAARYAIKVIVRPFHGHGIVSTLKKSPNVRRDSLPHTDGARWSWPLTISTVGAKKKTAQARCLAVVLE